MNIELNVIPRQVLDRSIIVTVPDQLEDIERYLRDYIFDNIIKAKFKVIK
jgi:hypothetical protein